MRGRQTVQPIRKLTDITRVTQCLEDHFAPKYKALFLLGINTGLRISDLLKLRVEDILEPNKKRRQVVERLEVREKKTGKYKNFPLNTRARTALQDYLKTYQVKSGPLFPSRNLNGKKPLTRTSVYIVLTSAAKMAGLHERVGTHTMRKTFGYHKYKEGVDITRLMRIFRHATPEITLRYIGITQDDEDKVYYSNPLG